MKLHEQEKHNKKKSYIKTTRIRINRAKVKNRKNYVYIIVIEDADFFCLFVLQQQQQQENGLVVF